MWERFPVFFPVLFVYFYCCFFCFFRCESFLSSYFILFPAPSLSYFLQHFPAYFQLSSTRAAVMLSRKLAEPFEFDRMFVVQSDDLTICMRLTNDHALLHSGSDLLSFRLPPFTTALVDSHANFY